MIERRIQHSGKSPFEIGWTRDGERGGPGAAGVFQGPCEIEKLAGIEGRGDAGTEHGVIAGAFAFLTEAGGGQPDKRMKPVKGADEFGADLQKPIVTRDVS